MEENKNKLIPENDVQEAWERIGRMYAAMAYIENEPTAKICIPEVAEKFFVSPSWIVHTFQKELGISFSQYVSKKKMLYAKQLLTSGLTPTQAAEQCGFFEYSTFYRQYKKHWGTSPKEDVKR